MIQNINVYVSVHPCYRFGSRPSFTEKSVEIRNPAGLFLTQRHPTNISGREIQINTHATDESSLFETAFKTSKHSKSHLTQQQQNAAE